MAKCELLDYIRQVNVDSTLGCKSECMVRKPGATCLYLTKGHRRYIPTRSVPEKIKVFDASSARVLPSGDSHSLFEHSIFVDQFEGVEA